MEGFTDNMTVLTNHAFVAATTLNLSSSEARELLAQIPARRFADILAQFSSDDFQRDNLVDALCQNDPTRKRASMDRKVRDWLKGKYQPTLREDLLELCFILKLNVADADAFLAMSGDEGLHWRNPRELTYAYALRKGMRYPEAKALFERVRPASTSDDHSVPDRSYTPLAYQEALAIETEDALSRYLLSAGERLGSFHDRAYQYFVEMMELLEQPDPTGGDFEERYSTRKIVETYLDKRLPQSWDKSRMDDKLRGILSGWPDEVTLSRMKNRRVDVNRKTLILLFLASDGSEKHDNGDQDDTDWDDEWPDETHEADDAFRSSYLRMNQMLSTCGYRMLDPRNPFDWVVIYCMRVSDDPRAMEGLTERLSDMLDVLLSASGLETE